MVKRLVDGTTSNDSEMVEQNDLNRNESEVVGDDDGSFLYGNRKAATANKSINVSSSLFKASEII